MSPAFTASEKKGCGSRFVAPEVQGELGYDSSLDVWGIGATVYYCKAAHFCKEVSG